MNLAYAAKVALLAGLMTTPVVANDGYEFYSNDIGFWHAGGYSGDPNLNPACYLETSWDDGSTFQVIKDLETGEFYIYIKNNQWNISDKPGDYSGIRINIDQADGNVIGGDFNYYLINKNTLVIPAITVDNFLPPFLNGTKLNLVMPGDISNAEVGLDNIIPAMQEMSNCITKSKDVKLNTSNADTKPKVGA